MQVAYPIDIEDALRVDLAALVDGVRLFAPPIPPDLHANDVMITSLGGGRVSGASHEYDVSVDCYADDDASAVRLANLVHGIVTSLPIHSTSTQYSDARANTPYMNPDTRNRKLSRQTFRATVICPGKRIEL